MPIELTSFAMRGLDGEQCRLLLAYGGEDFKDTRLSPEEWLVVKPTTPFRRTPVLNIDGKQYAQSMAICRYLGHRYGLTGDNIEEDFEIDQNIEFLNDIRAHALEFFMQPTEKLNNKKGEEKSKHVNPVLLRKLDEIIRANNGYLAAGKLTWADFVFTGQYEQMRWWLGNPRLDDKYPSFKKLCDTVLAHPKLQKYLATGRSQGSCCWRTINRVQNSF